MLHISFLLIKYESLCKDVLDEFIADQWEKEDKLISFAVENFLMYTQNVWIFPVH